MQEEIVFDNKASSPFLFSLRVLFFPFILFTKYAIILAVSFQICLFH